jgi:DNA-binding MarR family transcriptional regulator
LPSSKTTLLANLFFDARQMIGQHLPINQSLLRFDLLMTVLKEANKDDLTVKRLFATFGHSQTGLRYNYRQLILDGWIELQTDKNDNRCKLVKPSKKLISQFDSFANAVRALANQAIVR